MQVRQIGGFEVSALYGFGANEALLGQVLKPHRSKIVLASKGGMAGVDGKRGIDGRPETLKRKCEESLRRLQPEVVDLYYLHRWDKKVPIEESVGGAGVHLDPGMVDRLDAAINHGSVKGARYNAATRNEIDTEQFGLKLKDADHG